MEEKGYKKEVVTQKKRKEQTANQRPVPMKKENASESWGKFKIKY